MVQGSLDIYPFKNLPESEKTKIINGFAELTAQHALQLFLSIGLESFFESSIIDEITGCKYRIRFEKID